MNPSTQTENPSAHRAEDTQKKPYIPPQLETYGVVGTLTAGPSGGIADTFAGGTGGFQTYSPRAYGL